ERRPAGRRTDHRSRLDAAAIRFDAGDTTVPPLDPEHPRVRVDLDAAPVGAAREAPDDGVMPDDPAGSVVQRAEDRPGRPLGEIELWTQSCDLVIRDEAAVDSEQLVDLGALGHRHERTLGVRERQMAEL